MTDAFPLSYEEEPWGHSDVNVNVNNKDVNKNNYNKANFNN